MPNKPDNFALIIGSIKSGTTSLNLWLSQHPQICPCKTKEPNFFGNEDVYKKGFDWYRSQWIWVPRRHAIALEASTGYTKTPRHSDAAAKIEPFTSENNFRFIYIVRNPIDRIESQFNFGLAKVWGKGRTFEDVAEYYLNISSYYSQIEKYRAKFPRSSILLVDFNELHHPIPLCRKIFNFLNIKEDFEPPRLTVCNVTDRTYKFSAMQKEDLRSRLMTEMEQFQKEYGFDIGRWGF